MPGRLGAAGAAGPGAQDPKDFTLLCTGLARIDTPAKVNGRAGFGLDVKLPGLLTAVMAHARAGRQGRAVDDAAAEAVRASGRWCPDSRGVAVLADGYWPAQGARRAGRAVERRRARLAVV
ncbi:MAG: hypothetical protein IPJ97_18520 [Proteobacteria bacterium]|nr:hypothetical protein [Pseudomonadota bacterium]